MPVSTLPCPSRSAGLSRLVVDSTTRPPYHPQTIFKPPLNHLPTKHSSLYSKFHTLANCQLLLANYLFHGLSASSPTKMRSVSMSQFQRCFFRTWKFA